jgi:hypothetical protein
MGRPRGGPRQGMGRTMNRKDQAEMRRRLDEIMFIAESGYEPLGESMWVKCHAGDLLTHQEALEQIRKEEESWRHQTW